MAKVFWDSTHERWTLRQKEAYKGEIFLCIGTSKKSKAEARQNYQKNLILKKSKIDGAETAEKEKTVIQGLEAWYEMYRRHDGRQGKTISTDETTIRQIAGGSLAAVRIEELTPEAVQGYLISIRGQSTSTIKKIWGMIRPFLIHIERDDIVKKITRPSSTQPPQEKRAYTDDEIKALTVILMKPYDPHVHQGERGFHYGPALVTCLFLFLRVGELVELRAGDLQGDFITVKRQYVEVEHKVRLPKYGSMRRVPVMEEVKEIITMAAAGKPEDALLFPSRTGGRMYEKDLLRALASACTLAGVPRHTVHDLRHDGISRLVRMGVGVASVSRWAGHKSIETTLRRYYRDSGAENAADLEKIRGGINASKI